MIIEVPRERIEHILAAEQHETSADIQEKVNSAHYVQQQRFIGYPYTTNAQIGAKDMSRLVPLDTATKEFFLQAIPTLHLSPRALHRVQRIARTIADLAGAEQIQTAHIAEALQYRAKTYFAV